LEELIPPHLRHQFDIQTYTPIDYKEPRNERELNDINLVVIPDPYAKGGYDELKAFIDRNKIKVEKVTKESRDKCLEAVYNWGIQRGLRIEKQIPIPTA